MNLRTEKIIGLALLAIIAGFSLWAHANLPDVPMAVHFGLDGQPNGFQPRDAALLTLSGVSLGLYVLMLWVFPVIMPKSASIDRFPGVYGLVVIAVLALMTVMQAMIIFVAAGVPLDPVKISFAGIGILFIILGNYMPKMRKNWLIGIRTPWTLSDERVWDKTHRFAGPLFVLDGFVVLLSALCLPDIWRTQILLGSVLVVSVVSVVYSYIAARRLKLV